MMTEQEQEELYNKLKEMFGDELPNPEHFPRTFMHYLKLYQYFERMNNV